MRINKAIAQILNVSRRKADEILTENLVLVNGQNVQNNTMVNIGDRVKVLNKEYIFQPENEAVVVIYKKRGLVCSKNSQFDQKTVFQDLAGKFNNFNTIGRLDKDSEGLLLLTNNGDILNKMTHPKFGSEKKYLVVLNKSLSLEQIGVLEKGVFIDNYKTKPVEIKLYKDKKFDFLFSKNYQNVYYFILKEGRNRQIRKMVKSVGLEVKRLIRVQHGEYILSPEIYHKYK